MDILTRYGSASLTGSNGNGKDSQKNCNCSKNSSSQCPIISSVYKFYRFSSMKKNGCHKSFIQYLDLIVTHYFDLS